jgi:hypothetical protein
LQGRFELQSAAADIAQALRYFDARVVRDGVAGLIGALSIHRYFARQDKRLRFVARFGELPLHQRGV